MSDDRQDAHFHQTPPEIAGPADQPSPDGEVAPVQAGGLHARLSVRRRRLSLVALFLLTLSVYIGTGNGRMQTADWIEEVQVAISMASGHGFVDPGTPVRGGGVVRGVHGSTFAAHDLGPSLLIFPLAATLPRRWLPAASTLIDPVVSAISVLVFALILLELNIELSLTLCAAVLLAFASITWPFAHISFDVTPAACCLLIAMLGLTRQTTRLRPTGWCLVGGLGGAGAVVIRVDSAIPVLCIAGTGVLIAVTRSRRTSGVFAQLAAWLIPLGLSAGTYLWYDWIRFGSVLNSGHSGDPNSAMNGSLTGGLTGELFSIGRGFIVFSPVVILAAFGWPRLVRTNAPVAAAAMLAFWAALLAHARIPNWSGEDTWGPRYLVPVAPLLLLPLGHALELVKQHARSLAAWTGVAVIVAVSFAVQVVGASTSYYEAKFGDEVASHGLSPHQIYWSPKHAQIFVDARDLYHGLEGLPPYLTVAHRGVAPLIEAPVDWWWSNDLATHRFEPLAKIGVTICAVVAAGSLVVLIAMGREVAICR